MAATATKTEAKIKVLVSLPEATARFIRHLAVEEKRPASEIICELIQDGYKDRIIPQVSASA